VDRSAIKRVLTLMLTRRLTIHCGRVTRHSENGLDSDATKDRSQDTALWEAPRYQTHAAVDTNEPTIRAEPSTPPANH
jgi:hypothetical protein